MKVEWSASLFECKVESRIATNNNDVETTLQNLKPSASNLNSVFLHCGPGSGF